MENSSEQVNVSSVEGLSLNQFTKDLKQLFPIETLKKSIRITPQGLFVESSFQPTLITKFQNWLLEKTQGAVGKNEKKCFKRAFGTDNPSQYYLIEGKNTLLGYILPFSVKAPQSFGIPFYLGSLRSAEDYLHPNDERLQALPGVQVAQTPNGLEIQVKIKKWTYKVPQACIAEFRSIVERSKSLSKRYPNATASMLDTIKAFGSVLYHARPLERQKHIIVPQDAPKKKLVLCSGNLVFILNGDQIAACYENRGLNLFFFLKSEVKKLMQGKNKRVASFYLASPDQRDHIATIHIKGKAHTLSLNALRDLVEYCSIESLPHFKLGSTFTVFDCFSALSIICEQSEKIEKRLIERNVEMLSQKSLHFATYEKWIIAIDNSDCIVHCIEKGATKNDKQNAIVGYRKNSLRHRGKLPLSGERTPHNKNNSTKQD